MAISPVRRWLGPILTLLLASAGAHAAELEMTITYLTKAEPPHIPLSLVEPILKDKGIKGAELGIKDDQTTGRFLKNSYRLVEQTVPEDGDLVAAFKQDLAAGQRLFVADLHADQLLALTPLADQAGAILMNTRAPDDPLRTETCFKSLFNVAPSRQMLADGLAQYSGLEALDALVPDQGLAPRGCGAGRPPWSVRPRSSVPRSSRSGPMSTRAGRGARIPAMSRSRRRCRSSPRTRPSTTS